MSQNKATWGMCLRYHFPLENVHSFFFDVGGKKTIGQVSALNVSHLANNS